MRIALDIDDVLAAFYPHVCQLFGRKEIKCNIWDGIGVNSWIVEGFDKFANNEEFWRTMPIVSSPHSINFEVACYITYSREEIKEIRREWLKTNGFPEAPIFSTKNKLQTMIDEDIDLLIEDKTTTVEEINNSFTEKKAIQFKPPYMELEIENKTKIITHLSEVNKFIDYGI